MGCACRRRISWHQLASGSHERFLVDVSPRQGAILDQARRGPGARRQGGAEARPRLRLRVRLRRVGAQEEVCRHVDDDHTLSTRVSSSMVSEDEKQGLEEALEEAKQRLLEAKREEQELERRLQRLLTCRSTRCGEVAIRLEKATLMRFQSHGVWFDLAVQHFRATGLRPLATGFYRFEPYRCLTF